ncbi:MAG: amino acid adenylation domain-containing protein [Paludibacteraceae bacterium]|nr:amino acid adenylation domain-containing protein [Paludibacteraceae bacterium]
MKHYPLTQTQLGIYLSETAAEGNGDYNINLLYYLDPEVETERLVHALQQVVNHHPYIKSHLVQTDNGEIMIEDHSDAAPVVRKVSADSREEVLQAIDKPFDLLHDDLYRLVIYTLPDGSRMLNIDFHHILCDGMSTHNFHEEVSRVYSSTFIPELEQYGFEEALQSVEQRQGDTLAEAKEWYAQTFSAGAELDSMPLPDLPQSKEPSSQWQTEFISIDVNPAALQQCCEQSHVSVSIPFTAAFGHLLANYTASEQALFATIYHGRDRSHLNATGMFVKTLPVLMKADCSLLQLQEQIRGARQRTVYSFAEVTNDLDLHPRACFAYQANLHMYHLVLDGREQRDEFVRKHRPGFDLIVNVIQVANDYQIKIEYDTTAYSCAFIHEFCTCYANILNGLLTGKDIAQVALVNAGQQQVLDSFNPHPVEQAESATVVDLFRRMVNLHPDNIAVVYRDKQLTYKELDMLTDRLAAQIAATPSVKVVAILIERSEQMVISALAALKAGAAYQPLDSNYPQERLCFMVKDSGAQVLVCNHSLIQLIPAFAGTVIELESISPSIATKVAHQSINPSSPFILLYTSGSTGTPKGVVLQQHNIVTFCHWYRRFYQLTSDSRVLAYASFGFDADMMDLYPALTTGAAVVIAPEEIRLDLEALSQYMTEHGVTHSFMTTQVGYQFACNFATHPTLRHLSVGGEKLASLNPPVGYNFYNAYGPTECTIFSTICQVTHNEVNIPIGRPLDTLHACVVNRYGQPLPWGAAGELIIMGDQVGHGYLNQPEKTNAVFITFRGERAYRTGDIVRYRQNGDIEFMGRQDGQVKIRGFRIELKEVEAVIRQFHGINDCTVQAYDLEGGGKYIAAYIVSNEAVDIDALNAFIEEQKPPYMVPSVTMQIDAIPLNVNQKVDKKKLPKPEMRATESKETAPHALNILETQLVETVRSLTGQEATVNEPLVYYGLTSILGMRLSIMLYKQYGIKIAGKDLLGKTSILDIENRILERITTSQPAQPTQPDQPAQPASPFPLTFAQQGVYADCMMNPGTTVYNIPMDITLPKSIGVERLQQAVEKVLSLHPMLFAQFAENEDGETVQSFPLSCRRRTDGEPTASREMSEQLLTDYKTHFVRPFDLKKDTLFRSEIIETEKTLHWLLDVHHLVCDGGSEDVLLQQVLAILRGNEPSAENCSYQQFAQLQAEQDARGEMDEHKRYFDAMLQEMEDTTEVPGNRTEGKGHIRECYLPIPAELTCMNTNAEAWNDATFWFAATAYTVGRYAGVKDIYMTTVSNGRQDPEIAETVGMFVNTLPVAAHIRDQKVRDYLRETALMFHNTIAHENYPFARIAADYGYTANTTYAYQLGIIANNEIDGQAVSIESFGLDTPKFNLGIFIEMYHGEPSLVLQYDDAVYSEDTMLRLRDSIMATAQHLLADLDAPVRHISIMSSNQEAEVASLRHVTDNPVSVPTLHEGISRWAAQTPDSVAVIACDRTLTYREYDLAANDLAYALQQKGVQPGDRVVLLLPRTSDFLISMFAVLKCGAAFIPMDPQYPADRIAYILSDSNGRFVITTHEHMADYPNRALDIRSLLNPSAHQSISPSVHQSISPSDLAYLIYTSGSTGKPKGVMLQHKGICNYLTAHPANPHTYAVATKAKAVLCSATVSFDLSILEYGTALFNGKTVVFANEQATTDSKLLAQLYNETGADVLSGTPSRIEAYLEMDEYKEVVRRCKVIQMGGEKLLASLMKRLQEMTSAKIFNMYGPTEITICCNADQVNDCDEVTVGRPLPNFTERIVDKDLNELPVGVAGELLISGLGVCPGYNNLPDKTAEAFITWQGERAYRSGDVAKWTTDGKVIILGRTDHQVKLNGLRIELGEIETVMAQQPGIKQCVVQVRKVGNQDKLVAYYTANPDCPAPEVQDIKSGMAEHLTHYMVPGVFVRLEQFPITPAGKVDMRHLPEPQVEAQGEYVAPVTQAEKDFCDIFAKVLKIERVGATDDFFALGGTSLVAIKVVIAAEKRGYEITYSDVFAQPTAQAMAIFVGNNEHAQPATTADEAATTDDEPMPDITAVADAQQFAPLLQANTLQAFLNGERQSLGTVLLTGATGFLGIHVLYRLLTETDSVVYCPVRSKDDMSPDVRLRALLFYYFSNTFDDIWDKRLFVIEGEVTQREWMDTLAVQADTVINCLANVKHFSTSNDIEFVNVESVRNLVVWCCKNHTHLVHISTTSVAGRSIDGKPDPSHLFSEQEFEIGQTLDNRYAKAKYDAEKLILDAILHHGLNAKILRVGNLSARNSDGEFQANFQSNNFMATLRAYHTLGCCPYALLDMPCEFSPIDEVADAVLRLATTPKECVIFHPTNPHQQLMGDVLNEVHIGGRQIQPVEKEAFDQAMATAMEDESQIDRLRPLMAYNQKGNQAPRSIHATNAYTTQVLHRLGFRWSVTSWDYVQQFIHAIDGLGYFD